jgi:hypothetical protein
VSQKPSERLNPVKTYGYMQGRNPISIESVHARSQILKLCHRLRLPTGCRAVHETADQKGVGIRTEAKVGKHTYHLKIPTLNRGNHSIGSDGETPDQSRKECQHHAGNNCKT